MRELLIRHYDELTNHQPIKPAGRCDYGIDKQDEISIIGLFESNLMPYIKPIIGSFYVPRSVRSNSLRGGAVLA
ncbi:hypothetical protein K0T92_13905 [Paenibacillus oenotherae]|uniref:Uncharacterized protein n=1 Tax=Paenibacillus oenotherae TaxID=1435645 RepID=A0ABS7D8E1_9BACL|nr:hypothetical protein [Paenibacillus oenotherae]MBW7475836.1 hypothetical protein [Paenibacillus oenotherae]